jgi:hypothetical protein
LNKAIWSEGGWVATMNLYDFKKSQVRSKESGIFQVSIDFRTILMRDKGLK